MNRWLVIIVSCSLYCCNSLLGIEEAQVDPLLEASRREAEPDGGATKPPASLPEASSAPTTVQPSATEPEQTPEPPVTETPEDTLPDDDTSGNDSDDDDDDSDDDDDMAASGDDDIQDEEPSEATDDDASDDDVMTTSGDAGPDITSPTDDADAESVCTKYCEEIMEQCVGEMAQYRDLRQCLTVCELFPEGELTSDENENTVACRLRYASNARYAAGTELSAYCRQAGPGGDGRCGNNCEGYCTLMMQVCSSDVTSIYRYQTMNECTAACGALPVSDAPYSSTGTLVADGNHVQCRLFHVTSAAMLDAEEHCEHAIGITLCEAPQGEAD